ncbi:phosphatase PAP2 family protein [Flaviaesturariibacter flavus]|uniref:Phosphatase PAP2 family protein n=1 Tax=Flaviaesturariibacter flavus TaxID=2502780 RepID=A0A4R1BMT0_9BACT|nr:phosphatase PAP2 family protein [Flaviaesturariibacter flavus]TCJ18666.1 phosphatase PAP2 family protein [Flaviaesturariibacter flavus]
MPEQPTIYHQYRLSALTCILLILIAGSLLGMYGKDGSFVLINGWNTPLLDLLMPYVTYLGDGLIYIPILLLTFFFKRDYLYAIVAGIIICFLFTYGLKSYVFPAELRPFSLAQRGIAFHRVPGVELHENYSFPSGHTATAFTMALLLGALVRSRALALLLPLVALAVGFSRIYLAQHFLTDVTGGMVIGLATSFLSLRYYRWVRARKTGRERSPDSPVVAESD